MAYKLSPEYRKLSASTVKNYGYYLRHLDALADQEVANVKRKTLMAIRDALDAECGTGAANVFMRVTATLFAWARNRGWIDYSPAERVPALQGGHLAAWTPAEADLAISELSEPFARVIVLARYTGQRRGDLCAMMWSAYDGERIKVKQRKTGAQLTIPCHPVLKVALDEWHGTTTSTHILTSPFGRPWQPNHLTHELARFLPTIGLRDELNVHGLRKLAAAELASAGCTTHEIAAITGHRSLAMVQLYTASAEQERLAGAAILRWQNVTENARKTARK